MTERRDEHRGAGRWYLEGLTEGAHAKKLVTISVLPFLIGRRSDLPLCLQSRSVSKLHAEIIGTFDDLRLRDLQSRNGTFVNGNRVGEGTPLKPGDIIHFANLMFSLEH